MSAKSTFAALVAVLALAPVALGQGRIPIDQPMTIDKSGSYFLTRDIQGTEEFALKVTAHDVDINLGGYVVRGDVMLVPANTPPQRVELKNGRIEGRLWRNLAGNAAKAADGPTEIRISKVTGLAGGIFVSPCFQFFVSDSSVEGPVFAGADTGANVVQIIGSTFAAEVGFVSEAAFVRGNTFQRNLILTPDSFPSRRNLIERNTVRGLLRVEGSGAEGSHEHFLLENTAGSIEIAGDANHLRGNTVRSGSIVVNGSRNTIEGNTVKGSGYGLVLNGDDNVYLDNILRRNGLGPVQDNGLGNFDGGGNVR